MAVAPHRQRGCSGAGASPSPSRQLQAGCQVPRVLMATGPGRSAEHPSPRAGDVGASLWVQHRLLGPCSARGLAAFCSWRWLGCSEAAAVFLESVSAWGEQTWSQDRPFKNPRRDREGSECRISKASTDNLQGCVVTVYVFQLNKTNLADDCV